LKSNRSRFIALLISAQLISVQGCSLFKSDYATLQVSDLTVKVNDLPEMQKRTLAQSEQARKQLIEQFKKAYALAQAAEAEDLDDGDEYKKRSVIIEDQLLGREFTNRNLEFSLTNDELTKYATSNRAAFDADINLLAGESGIKATDEEKSAMSLQWAEMKIRAAKGREAGLLKDPIVKSKLRFELANLLANLYAGLMEDRNKLSEQEKVDYIAKNPTADVNERKKQIEALLQRLKNGEPFEKIADEMNEDGTRGIGGDLNWTMKGKMDPDFEKAAFALGKGQYTTEPVKSSFGFHLIKVDDRRPVKKDPNTAPTPSSPSMGAPASPAEVEEEIRVRHIFISTQEADTFERRLIDERVKRAVEDATLKFAVSAPADFTVEIAGFNPNTNRLRQGGGTMGPMRSGNPSDGR
jgi:parvulin-like peptidyl-prolyl isomerase